MNKSTKLSLIAAAMGGLMAGSMTRAATPAPAISGKAVVTSNKQIKAVNAGVRALEDDKDAGKHDCKGKNDCKGKGGCKSSDNGCKGKNSCKGHGGCKGMDDKKDDKKEDKKD